MRDLQSLIEANNNPSLAETQLIEYQSRKPTRASYVLADVIELLDKAIEANNQGLGQTVHCALKLAKDQLARIKV